MMKTPSCKGGRLFHLVTRIAVRRHSLLGIDLKTRQRSGVKNTMDTSGGISCLRLISSVNVDIGTHVGM